MTKSLTWSILALVMGNLFVQAKAPSPKYHLENRTGKEISLLINGNKVHLKDSEKTLLVANTIIQNQFVIEGPPDLLFVIPSIVDIQSTETEQRVFFQGGRQEFCLVICKDMKILARPARLNAKEKWDQNDIERWRNVQPPAFPLEPKPDGVAIEEYRKQLAIIVANYSAEQYYRRKGGKPPPGVIQ